VIGLQLNILIIFGEACKKDSSPWSGFISL
jgi:hypothetical protein